jgi:uncharacterized membrane protein YdbT with pleckstrin-like domain
MDPTPEAIAKQKESQARYPELRLSIGEYVIEEVRRHPIGIISIWFVAGLMMLIVLAIVPLYVANQQFISQLFMVPAEDLPAASVIMVPVLIMTAVIALGGFIATIVYQGNRFYLTNESVVQHLQYSLFSTKQQVVNLINVEDASSTQFGIIEQLLNYGTLRLSTQGEETIYNFRFVANPKKVVADVNDAMEMAVRRLEGASNYPPNEY